MRLCIVPMKPLADAKARLSRVLSPPDRRALSLAMLADVVAAGRALGPVWVLNSDDDAAAVAAAGGAEPRPDPTPGAGLNPSLDAAAAHAAAEGATAVLVLSADLGCVSAGDVEALAAAQTPVAIAPDRTGRGTNALWRQPPDLMPVAFGAGSFLAHAALARAAGSEPAVVRRPGLALDVDTPEDLDRAWRLGPAPATGLALRALGWPERGTAAR